MRWFWFLCLTAGAVSDIKERQVSCRLIMVCAVVGWIYAWKTDLPVHIPGLAAGLAVLMLNKLTQGAIGKGDGWFLIASSGYLTAGETGILVLDGFIVSWVWSVGLILRGISCQSKKSKKKVTLPFLACMWPAGLWLLLR